MEKEKEEKVVTPGVCVESVLGAVAGVLASGVPRN